MLILAIDTATTVGAFALYDSEKGIVAEITTNLRGTHSETAMEIIDYLLKISKLTRDNIDKIAVSIGPGSFTGIRIGVALAKGLALALRKPIVGINELDILANSYSGDKKVVSIIDARKERVFCGIYEKKQDNFIISGSYKAEELIKILQELDKEESFIFLGDGAFIYKELIKQELKERALFLNNSLNIQRASILAELSIGREDNIYTLEPYYISKSQAEREKETKN